MSHVCDEMRVLFVYGMLLHAAFVIANNEIHKKYFFLVCHGAQRGGGVAFSEHSRSLVLPPHIILRGFNVFSMLKFSVFPKNFVDNIKIVVRASNKA